MVESLKLEEMHNRGCNERNTNLFLVTATRLGTFEQDYQNTKIRSNYGLTFLLK